MFPPDQDVCGERYSRAAAIHMTSTGTIEVLSQSSQLFSTVSFTRLVYSLRLSLYKFEASTLAGEEVLGSLRRLHHGHESVKMFSKPKIVQSRTRRPYL